ncbi:MAG: hypothetical protein KF768_07030 [Phycisphaeraceae bacterium]|nr:hypothetical protein [Phycisphaeraceae bacterium]
MRIGKTLISVVALAATAGLAMGQASVSIQNLTAGGQNNNPTFLLTGQIAAWMTTPLGNPGVDFSTPDTIIRLLDSADTLIVSNDDAGTGSDAIGGGPVGAIRGSLVRYGAFGSGLVNARVVGFDAAETGNYALTSVVISPGSNGDFTDNGMNNTLPTAQNLALPVPGAIWGLGTITAGQTDYFSINLLAGQVLSAFTIPLDGLNNMNFSAVDTRLDVRSAADTIITSNDDAGADGWGAGSVGPVRGSAVRYEATADGLAHISVRGFGASDAGSYALVISVIPSPGAAALALLGLPLAFRRRR